MKKRRAEQSKDRWKRMDEKNEKGRREKGEIATLKTVDWCAMCIRRYTKGCVAAKSNGVRNAL
jgi:hypothetical protein